MHRPHDLRVHHQANWESLNVILPAQERGYLLMACETPEVREQARLELEKRHSRLDHHLQAYPEQPLHSLLEALSQDLPASALSGEGSPMVHLTHMENSLLLGKYEQSELFLWQLAGEAEALQQAFPFVLILWTDMPTVAYLQEQVPVVSENALDTYFWWDPQVREAEAPYEQMDRWRAQLQDESFAPKAQTCLELAQMWEARASYQQAMIWYQRVLEYLQLETDASVLGPTYLGMGRVLMLTQDTYQAIDYFRLALDQIDPGDPLPYGDGCRYMGICQFHVRKLDLALEYLEKSVEAYLQVKDEEALALNYQDMALVYHQQGKAEEALTHLKRAKALAERLEQTEWALEIERSMARYAPKPEAPAVDPFEEAYGYAKANEHEAASEEQVESFRYPPASKTTFSNKPSPTSPEKKRRMGRRAFLERFMRMKDKK